MEKKLLIEGMSCNHCVNHLKTALTEDIEGINVKEVNLENKYAIVEMKEDVSIDDLRKLISELDFQLVGIE